MVEKTALERASAAIAALEADIESVAVPANKVARPRPILFQLCIAAVTTAVLIVLPFVVLVRVFTYSYTRQSLDTWLALGTSVLATVLVVTLYAALVSRKLTGRSRVRTLFRRVALPLVLAYCVYALAYLSSVNAKGAEVREYYRSLHPALRIAVSTVILADRNIVVTDTYRTPADYATMGLPVYQQSLHYRQNDGYVHAVDLRTQGRAPWRNWAVQAYFGLMGFTTLRHVGTEDHLHVGLPVQ